MKLQFAFGNPKGKSKGRKKAKKKVAKASKKAKTKSMAKGKKRKGKRKNPSGGGREEYKFLARQLRMQKKGEKRQLEKLLKEREEAQHKLEKEKRLAEIRAKSKPASKLSDRQKAIQELRSEGWTLKDAAKMVDSLKLYKKDRKRHV